MKVLGMGNALVDILAVIADDSLLQKLQLPKGSMQLIDSLKLQELTGELNKLETNIVSGGSASNTIAGLARLGVETGFIGAIGKDKYGQFYKNDFQNLGVKLYLTELDTPSGIATTFISGDGERTFGTYLGAAAQLSSKDLKPEYFEGYDYFYIEGYLVQSYDLIQTAVEMAKAAGAKVVLDFASYNIVAENKEFLIKLIDQYVDIVFANRDEIKALFGSNAEEGVTHLSQLAELAIVKAGVVGSWIQTGDTKLLVSADAQIECKDSTGAGDLYASGFIYGLMKGASLEESGHLGTLLAAEIIQVIGARIPETIWDKLMTTDIKM